MRLPKDNPLTVHNFFVYKFDSTGSVENLSFDRHNLLILNDILVEAWNDFDAIPRSASLFGLTDHWW
jgi:hypothetical protein